MKGKKLLLAVLLMLFCITLSACRCAPYEVLWRIGEATFEKTFINGQTVKVTRSNHSSYGQPDGLYDGNAYIHFEENGTVVFRKLNGELLQGTYTYTHNGFQNTLFQMEFSDGSRVTDGVAGSYYGFSELEFTYQGVSYAFTDHAYTTEEDYQDDRDQIAYDLRNLTYADMFVPAVTTRGEDGKWKITDVIPQGAEKPLDIYAEGFTLEAVHITESDEIILLDDLMEGNCLCVILYDYTTGTRKPSGVIIYYVDPLPQEPTIEDVTFATAEKLSWLPGMLQNYENAQIKITSSATNLPVGFAEYHQYLRDPEEVRQYLENLNALRLWPEEEPIDISGGYRKNIVRVTAGEQTYTFVSIGNYLVLGEKWYQFIDDDGRVVSLPDIDYSKAVKTLRTDTDLTEVYNKKEFLYSVTGFWKELEFVIDTEEHNWTFAQETRTLVCDFGEVTVYDNIHFRYKGQNYVVAGEKDFSALFE